MEQDFRIGVYDPNGTFLGMAATKEEYFELYKWPYRNFYDIESDEEWERHKVWISALLPLVENNRNMI